LTGSDSQRDVTINSDLGFRLNLHLTSSAEFHSSMSGGLDFKTYELTSYGTNNFTQTILETDYAGNNTFIAPSLPIIIPQANDIQQNANICPCRPVLMPVAAIYSGTTSFGLGLDLISGMTVKLHILRLLRITPFMEARRFNPFRDPRDPRATGLF